MHAKSLQSGPTLCDPMDHSPPGSFVLGILQSRTLEWVAIPSSTGSSQPREEPASLTSPALAGKFVTISTIWEDQSERCMPFYIERNTDPFY